MNDMTTITVQVPTELLSELGQAQQAYDIDSNTLGYGTRPEHADADIAARMRRFAESSRNLATIYRRLAAAVDETPFAEPIREAAAGLAQHAREIDRDADQIEGA